MGAKKLTANGNISEDRLFYKKTWKNFSRTIRDSRKDYRWRKGKYSQIKETTTFSLPEVLAYTACKEGAECGQQASKTKIFFSGFCGLTVKTVRGTPLFNQKHTSFLGGRLDVWLNVCARGNDTKKSKDSERSRYRAANFFRINPPSMFSAIVGVSFQKIRNLQKGPKNACF